MTQQSRPVRVGVMGLDERMRNALRLFFEGPCKNRCVMVEEDSAETMIIDLDGYGGHEHYNDYRRRHPEQPVILLSLHETQAEEAICLQKPLTAKALISALSQAKHRIQAAGKPSFCDTDADATSPESTDKADPSPDRSVPRRAREVRGKREHRLHPSTHHAAMHLGEQNAKGPTGTAPDIDARDPQQLAHAQYDPHVFLQSHLTRACETADSHNRCVRLDTPRGSIYVFPEDEGIVSKLNDSQLRTLSVVPMVEGSLNVALLKDGDRLEQSVDLIASSREALIWKSALWASRGRVPAGTRLDVPVFLRRWPNLTRLMLFPHALRIAALWTRQPHSLLATAKTLAIPQRHVFGFYSAAHALGLASISQRAVDTLFAPEPLQKNQQRGLFVRILDRLRKDWEQRVTATHD